MKSKNATWPQRAFLLAFSVLTLLCWCPLGYGAYGPVEHLMGIPSWAVIALLCAAVLFALEWIYLFGTGLSMNDEDLPGMISQLEAVDLRRSGPVKGNQ